MAKSVFKFPKHKVPSWFVEFKERNNQRLDRSENNISSLKWC